MRRFAGWFYRAGWLAGRFVALVAMNVRVLRREAADLPGGYVLACTHLSHTEPAFVSVVLRRKVDWMARAEFFRSRVWGAALRAIDAFPVNRWGACPNAIRTAIDRARRGRIVGIFPEGGVCRGASSACRGGEIRHGACLVACRAGVPILPVIVLGTHELNRVWPWLPIKQGRVWMAFGTPIPPRSPDGTRAQRRAARAAMADDIRRQFASLYQELLDTYGLPDQAGETYSELAVARTERRLA